MDEFKKRLNYEDMLRIISVECSAVKSCNLLMLVNAWSVVESLFPSVFKVDGACVKQVLNKCEISHGRSPVVEYDGTGVCFFENNVQAINKPETRLKHACDSLG